MGAKQSMHDNEPTDIETVAGLLMVGDTDMQCLSNVLTSELCQTTHIMYDKTTRDRSKHLSNKDYRQQC